jgi:uncharacterized protein (DUF924 family)
MKAHAMTDPAPAGLQIFPDAAREVLAFWFDQPLNAPDRTVEERARLQKQRKEWWEKNDAFDGLCGERMGALCEAALNGELDHWDASADAAVARIILLDQITRNIFRGTPRAFAGDAAALASAHQLVARGAHDHLTPIEQSFALMPYEHAEDLKVQDESVRLCEALLRRDGQVDTKADFARRHRDIIARFGRFPHRNAILGRESTVEEIEFLKGPNSAF